MNRHAPATALTALILGLAACSQAPSSEAAPTEATPLEETVVDGEAALDAGTVEPSEAAVSSQDAPQGIPADPNRPGRPGGRDRDGPSTLAEMQARSERGFARLDADGDGMVTTAELGDGEGGRGARMLERADADNDGRITRAEVRDSAAARFRQMDSNGDGKITEEERPQY